MIEKHGNTFAPGDRIIRTAKTASATMDNGEVIDIDADMGLVHVRWDSGDVGFVNLTEVEPA